MSASSSSSRPISRRRFLWGAGGAAATAAVGGFWPGRGVARAGSGRPDSGAPRNVLLLMADQHRQDYHGGRGQPAALTPHLDALARRGFSFENTFCQSPLCVPGRTSMLLGRWVHSHGVPSNQHLAPRDLPSFPQRLREHGFATGCYGKLHVQGRSDLDWDEIDEFVDRVRPEAPEGRIVLRNRLKGGQPLGQPAPFADDQHADWLAKESTIDFLRRHRNDRWFVQCSFEKPHPAFQPPPRHWDRVDRSRLALPDYPPDDLGDVSPILRRSMESLGLSDPREEEILDAMQGYLGNVSFVDELFGEVLEALEALGLADDTLIVHTSDSGELLGSHRFWEKLAFFEEAIRVPLTFHRPGTVGVGVDSARLAAHVDLFPTIFDLLSLPIPETVQGESLAPVLRGAPGGSGGDGDLAGGGSGREWVPCELGWRRAMHRGRRWKLIDNGPDDTVELYDLVEDPREITNLADRPEHAERVRSLRAELAAWKARDAVPLGGTTRPRKRQRKPREGRTQNAPPVEPRKDRAAPGR